MSLLMILTVAQSQDGIGSRDVIERHPFPLDVAAVAVIEGVDV